MALQIAILGSLEPRVNGDVLSLPQGKQAALLTMLAVRAPDPVSAEAAAEALWPRAAPAEALRSLQVTVSRVRRSLGAAGSALETVASGYRLAVEADASDASNADAFFDELAAARGDWARAARLFLAGAQTTRSPGLKGMFLRHIAIALAHLGADEDALELAAAANAICESIGEAPSDPLTARYGSALDDARERLGPQGSAHAARQGAALPESDSTTRAAEMVQTALVTRAA